MSVGPVPIQYRQVGWMRCVACRDAPRMMKGRMWLGVNKAGVDQWIVCPECNGTEQVPRYQIIDATTGKEIDYEAYGRGADGEPIHHAPSR